MKIGIITLFDVPNYGAMLQCYALTKYVEGLGHEVFLYKVPFGKSNRVFRYLKRKILLSNMTDFVLGELPAYTTDLSVPADLYMVGSDQVWNPAILGRLTETFMLSFVPQGAKKVAYAASFGTEEWMDEEGYDRAKQLLGDFNYITVREKSGVELLKRRFGLPSYQVLDPCFLLEDYRSLMKKQVVKGKDQLVTYKLVYSYEWYLEAKRLAGALGCRLMELNPRYLKKRGDMHGVNVKFYPVSFWLSSLAAARYVVTDSFHGCVFALLFRKQFVVLPGIKERSTRLTSLLLSLNLTDRMVNSVDECRSVLKRTIDYANVSEKLDKLREDSRLRLSSMLRV